MIVLAGAPGAGKTTVLRVLRETYGVDTVPEPAEDWADCQRRLGEGRASALELQTQVLLALRARRVPDGLAVVERDHRCAALFRDAMRAQGMLRAEEAALLGRLADALFSEPHERPLRVLLSVDAEEAVARVRARGHAAEAAVGVSYMRSVVAAHEAGEYALRVDATQPPEAVAAEIAAWGGLF